MSKSKELFTDNRFILEQDKSLPKCIICDLDGTLALTYNRNIYDGTKVYQDKINPQVHDIIKTYSSLGYFIIFLTGRDHKYYNVTNQWILDNIMSSGYTLITRTHDTSKIHDDEFKRGIFETFIKDKLYVAFVLEDRDRVVKMWRDLGLLCLQVYYGNF
jgi:hydroxymethylpyrimidine pyrophosphatase-like HAD family hydrolase